MTPTEVIVKITADVSRLTSALRGLSRTIVVIGLCLDGDALRRPDGRLRRTGHRHRGTLGWRRRFRSSRRP